VTDPRTPTVYDRIGDRYAAARREDPRLAGRIHAALEGAASVLDVGAGPGSYERARTSRPKFLRDREFG